MGLYPPKGRPPKGTPPRRPPRKRCPEGTTTYTIRRGDTFFSIARRYNISVAALRRANPDVDPDRLVPGQIICIPERASTPRPPFNDKDNN